MKNAKQIKDRWLNSFILMLIISSVPIILAMLLEPNAAPYSKLMAPLTALLITGLTLYYCAYKKNGNKFLVLVLLKTGGEVLNTIQVEMINIKFPEDIVVLLYLIFTVVVFLYFLDQSLGLYALNKKLREKNIEIGVTDAEGITT